MGNIEVGKDAPKGVSVTYYVAECMEFSRYGEYLEGIQTAQEAVEKYMAIPSDRLNAVKGIGIHVQSPDEPGIFMEYGLVHMQVMDIDALQLMDGFTSCPQIMEAVKALIAEMPELKLIDTDKLLDEKIACSREVDVMVVADKINRLQKKIDPGGYEAFYPDEEKHRNKIAMQLLISEGKEEYIKWLDLGRFIVSPGLATEVQQLLQTLKESNMKYPDNMQPFVYVECTEDWGLESGDALELGEAVYLFGKLDYEQCMARKNNEALGYNKTWFRIYYLNGGELCNYSGRQDFGDGEGNLFQHIEAYQNFYFSPEGQEVLESLSKDQADDIRENCAYVRDEFLPSLKYFCNLKEIEKAILEERQLNTTMPLVSEQDAARSQYQKDVLAFIEESRRILNCGGELPEMPEIRDYERDFKTKGYREQVMKEIEAEAKSYNMPVDEYAKNGYEPKNKIH